MTTNKTQEQSSKVVGMDLRNECFSHDILYIACLCVSSSGVLLKLLSEGRTKNIVYKEVFSKKKKNIEDYPEKLFYTQQCYP
jgi:hypothetical protein